MASVRVFDERIQMFDPENGIKIIQLTSFPIPSGHFPYNWPSITPDNKRVLFFSQRWAQRDAPWDLFRCDIDGLYLTRLTERTDRHEEGGYYGRPSSIMKADGSVVYVVWDKLLCEVDVETEETRELVSLADHCPAGHVISNLHIASSGTRLFAVHRGEDETGNLRIDLDTGTVEEVDFGGTLFGCAKKEPRVVVQRGKVVWGTVETENGERKVENVGDSLAMWSMDEDGSDARMICPQMFAHATLIGDGTTIQGTGLPPEHCIWIAEEGKEPRRLCRGPYFWHSGPSFDGEWIVSDTNWPDDGLQLIHVPTGYFRTLCHPRASQDHVEYGHPHPALSQDGRVAVFRSDRTHVSQIYVALITDEFRESIIEGELDNPKDKWI